MRTGQLQDGVYRRVERLMAKIERIRRWRKTGRRGRRRASLLARERARLGAAVAAVTALERTELRQLRQYIKRRDNASQWRREKCNLRITAIQKARKDRRLRVSKLMRFL